jgi:hypothetical protein
MPSYTLSYVGECSVSFYDWSSPSSLTTGRLDIYVSLSTGESAHFLTEGLAGAASLTGRISFPSDVKDHLSYRVQYINDHTHPKLVTIFGHLRYFVGLLNMTAISSKYRLLDNDFQNCYCWLQYRLLQLRNKLDNAIDESLRLAMLAFLTTIFQIPGKPVVYPYLGRQFREYYLAADISTPRLQYLSLWTLVVGAMSVWDVEEPWLGEQWRTVVRGLTWPEIRGRLKEVIWIDFLHDKAGKCVFDRLTMREP